MLVGGYGRLLLGLGAGGEGEGALFDSGAWLLGRRNGGRFGLVAIDQVL